MNEFIQNLRLLMIANFLSSWDGRRSYAEDLITRLQAGGLSVVGSSSLAFKPARLADMVLSALGNRGRYDVALVEVYSGQAFLWAEAVTKVISARGIPLVLVLHGGNLPRFAQSHPVRVRRVLQAATEVVAPSPFLRNRFLHWRPDIRVIPNAIDLHAYSPRLRAPASPRLFWLRAFHSIYQPTMAIRILARVASRYPEAHLTMAGVDKGDGSLQECRRLAAGLGLSQQMTFAGVIPKAQIGAALSQADIFLNTTTIDNTPVSVLEALASGLCVVSTNVGGVPHLVRDSEEALLVGPEDEDGMVNAVCRLLEEPSLAARLSRSGRSKAEAFGWNSVLPCWMELLSSAAQLREARPAC